MSAFKWLITVIRLNYKCAQAIETTAAKGRQHTDCYYYHYYQQQQQRRQAICCQEAFNDRPRIVSEFGLLESFSTAKSESFSTAKSESGESDLTSTNNVMVWCSRTRESQMD